MGDESRRYPKVFDEFMAAVGEFGDLSSLPTRAFVEPMDFGDEIDLSFGQGVNVTVKLIGLGDLDDATGTREVFFELNGFPRSVKRVDTSAASSLVTRPKAAPGEVGSVGAPMPGVVVDVKVAVGDAVAAGEPMVVLSAMKMETVVSASTDGVVANIPVGLNDAVNPGDLLVTIDSKGAVSEPPPQEELAA